VDLRIRTLVLVALAALAIVALGAACSDDDDDDGGGDNAALQEQITKTQVLAALTAFRAEDLHAFDEEAQDASEIDAGWSGKVTRLHRVAGSVTWPEALADRGAEFATSLADLEAALDGDDLSEVKGAVSEMHAAWHELDGDGYAYIAGEEPSDEGDHSAGGSENGMDEEETDGASH
jgi:hypothetical protein